MVRFVPVRWTVRLWVVLSLALPVVVGAQIPPAPFGGSTVGAASSPTGAEVLTWDAISKDITLKPGETNASIIYSFTNNSPRVVQIMNVRPSCGCTLVKLPSYPWKIAPGTSGSIDATIDLRGKRGTLFKTLDVALDTGTKRLAMKITMPDLPADTMDDRLRNQDASRSDRQAVFRGECAICHLVPSVGRTGKILYQSACGICHEAEHRATMVPDLKAVAGSRDSEHWLRWINYGRHGSLMPAFSRTEGGPFTESQIDSLVAYLSNEFPKEVSNAAPTAGK